MHVMFNIITFKLHATELLRCMVPLYLDTFICVAVNTVSTWGTSMLVLSPYNLQTTDMELSIDSILSSLLLLYGDSMTSDTYKHAEDLG